MRLALAVLADPASKEAFALSSGNGYWSVRVAALLSGDLLRTLRHIDDNYTHPHCQRVARLAALLAQELGLSRVERVYQAALYHDVGKIAVPLEILMKPGTLSAEERLLVNYHVEESYRIVWEATGDRELAQAACHHHERYDGTGYLEGLRRGAISDLGRLIAVADVFDALTQDRPYRPAWPWPRAMALIQEEAGKSFDPEVVAALPRVLSQLTRSRRWAQGAHTPELRGRELVLHPSAARIGGGGNGRRAV